MLQRNIQDPSHLSASDLLQLQRTAGNRAVNQLLARRAVQARLTVGAADDPYEREADRVASQVMSASTAPSVSRQSELRQEDDQTAQRMPATPFITPLAQRASRSSQEHSVDALGAGSFDAGADVERQLSANRSGGSPLPSRLRSDLEPKFGADFSNVRVHTGAQSDQLNHSIGAQAFTHGSHIYMGADKYNPGTGSGKHLLAHELTHVVQQGGAKQGAIQTKQRAELARDSISNSAQSNRIVRRTPSDIFRDATRGGGREVPYRSEMERSFGASFSGVKSYMGQTVQMRSLRAQAAAQGESIAFASENPGKELVAHELAHVAQNKRAGRIGPVQGKSDVSRPGDAAEHEATAAAEKVIAGEPVRVSASPRAGIQLAGEIYGGLGDVAKEKIDSKAFSRYRDAARTFETNLGNGLARDPRSLEGANIVISRLKSIVETYAQEGHANLDAQLVSTFGVAPEHATQTVGAVKNTAKNITKMLDQGNLRVKMTMYYNAFVSGQFAAMLEKAFTDILGDDQKKLLWQNIDSDALTGAQGDLVTDRGRDTRNYFKRKGDILGQDRRPANREELTSGIRKDRAKNKLTPESVGESEQPLSYQELKTAFPQHTTSLKQDVTRQHGGGHWKGMSQEDKQRLMMQKVGKQQIKWRPGYLNYVIGDTLKAQEKQFNVLLLGGLSGSMDMYMHGAEYLKLTKAEKEKLRLAALGSMLPSRDHSFYEIMYAAKRYGLDDYVEGPEGYKRILPLSIDEIKVMGSGGAYFPGEFLSPEHKDAMASREAKTAEERKEMLGAGIPTAGLLTAMMGDPKTDDAKSVKLKTIINELVNYQKMVVKERLTPDQVTGEMKIAQFDKMELACMAYISKSKSRMFHGTEKKEKKGLIEALLERIRTARDNALRTTLEEMGAPSLLLVGVGKAGLPSFYRLVKLVMAATFTGNGATKPDRVAYQKLKSSEAYKGLLAAMGKGGLAPTILDWLLNAYHPAVAANLLGAGEQKNKKTLEDLLTGLSANERGRRIIAPGMDRPDEGGTHKAINMAQQGSEEKIQSIFGLLPEEIEALLAYTGARYKEFNDSDKTTGSIVDLRKFANSGLKKLPSFTGPLYRGDYMFQNGHGNLRVGKRRNSAFYTSTAKTLEGSFIPARPTAHVYISHTGAKDIEAISQKPWEAEALFGPTNFEVVGIVNQTAPVGQEDRQAPVDPVSQTLTGPGGTPQFQYKGQNVQVQFNPAYVNRDNWKRWYSEKFSNKAWVFWKQV